MGQAKKILIVDDEEILAENLQTHFKRCGWDARIACTGSLAVSAAKDFMPEIILLDYNLPDMNGFEALDEIRMSNQCCGCVLMTAHPTDTVLEDAERHGIRRILCKPFSFAELEVQSLATVAESSSFTSNLPAQK